jgi:hypothetical protein
MPGAGMEGVVPCHAGVFLSPDSPRRNGTMVRMWSMVEMHQIQFAARGNWMLCRTPSMNAELWFAPLMAADSSIRLDKRVFIVAK